MAKVKGSRRILLRVVQEMARAELHGEFVLVLLYLVNPVSQQHKGNVESSLQWTLPSALTHCQRIMAGLSGLFLINFEAVSENAWTNSVDLSHWHAASFHRLQERQGITNGK